VRNKSNPSVNFQVVGGGSSNGQVISLPDIVLDKVLNFHDKAIAMMAEKATFSVTKVNQGAVLSCKKGCRTTVLPEPNRDCK
jgi:hypothetical protein